MERNHIHFKDAHGFYFEPLKLDTETIEHSKRDNVRFIFLLENGANSENKSAKYFKRAGVRIFRLDGSLIRSGDVSYIRKQIHSIHQFLKRGNCLLLYTDDLKAEAHSFVACSVLGSKVQPITPEIALRLVTGKKEKIDDGSIVSRYYDSFFITSEKFDTIEFKKPKISIRFKLLAITSTILMAALLSMIGFATELFRSHSETLIQEYNLSLARLVGFKVQTELVDLGYRVELLAYALSESQPNSPGEKRAIDQFFRKNKDVIYLAVAKKDPKGSIVLSRKYANLQASNQADERVLLELVQKNQEFLKAFSGQIIIQNLGPETKLPVLGYATPIEGHPNEAVIAFILSGSILRSFQATRQTEIFDVVMVDARGSIIAHSNEVLASTGGSLVNLPIVKTMLASTNDNGSKKYTYEGVQYLGSFQNLDVGGLGVISTVEASKVFEAVYSIQRQTLFITGIVLTLAFLFVYFFAKTLSVPIVRLVEATRKIESGHFHVEIEPSTKDEIGLLTTSFRSMAHGLEEREKIKDAFGRFVNPAIAEKALRGEIKLGGNVRECAVMFSDLRNFTALSEHRKPEEVLEILNHYFTAMVDCVHSTSGVVDKFIGDAIMAHWGAIENRENDTESAILGALAMRTALQRLNREMEGEARPRLFFGCGINTGDVIAGQIGAESRLEYTVIGDAVNLASRIEYLNKLFGTDILISESSRARIGDRFSLIQMPSMRIKGKTDPQTVFCVLGLKDDTGAPKTLTELRRVVGIEFNVEQAEKTLRASSDVLIGGTLNLQ